MGPIKILTVFGTRPEAIKMAPILQEMKRHKAFESRICVTGQHREMLDQVLKIFELKPDFDLNIMKPGQTSTQITSRILSGLEPIMELVKPDWVFVHGDTTTTAATALAAFYQSIPVAHVEAGLRTNDLYSPWPEEMNRRITSLIASCHFAPTKKALENLLNENIDPTSILVSGNTVIDALVSVTGKLNSSTELQNKIANQLPELDNGKRLIVVTGHRRESFGEGLENICNALIELSHRQDVQIIYPVHLNPNVKVHVHKKLSGYDNIHLIAPLDYLSFVYLMSKAYIILTDSGGIQEEAPSLGVPVLLTRKTTERPEALRVGAVKLVGQDSKKIVSWVTRLLTSRAAYDEMSKADNPYGDGKAAIRIISHMLKSM